MPSKEFLQRHKTTTSSFTRKRKLPFESVLVMAVGTELLLVHDAAKPWERRSPERLGINAQVGDTLSWAA